MLLTRRAEFCASHICRQASMSQEENQRLFGAAANPHGHGHNFVLEVTIEGDPDPVTGMVFDLKDLKEIIAREVIQPFDHRFLNYEAPPFDRLIPTVENIAIEIWRRIEPQLAGSRGKLRNVRLYETSDLYVDYSGGV
jgi:6-pyruvoyltetrahydropterin/6-carboxytetrahydropterin synthase